MTELLIDGGQLRYGLWEAPEIILTGSEQNYTVPPEFEHRPDLIAHRFYADVDLWWVICSVNNILLPLRDLAAGMTLVIPEKTNVDKALVRARR
jgi:hypothetical protein